MKIVNHRDAQGKSGGVNGGGEAWEYIMDQPEIKMTESLIFKKPLADGQISECPEWG